MTNINDLAHAVAARSSWLDQQKLQKLCYLVYGFHLATTGNKVVDSELRAWPSGPAFPELHGLYEGNRGVLDASIFTGATALGQRESRVVDFVIENYSLQSGAALGHHTQEHLPWLEAKGRASNEIDAPLLDDQVIASFFRALNDAPVDQVSYANRFAENYNPTINRTTV